MNAPIIPCPVCRNSLPRCPGCGQSSEAAVRALLDENATLRARLAEVEAEREQRTPYYLIEKPEPYGVYWFSAGRGHDSSEFYRSPLESWFLWFSSDVRHAIRFRSRDDAEAMLRFGRRTRQSWCAPELDVLVTEHMDMTPRADDTPTPEPNRE